MNVHNVGGPIFQKPVSIARENVGCDICQKKKPMINIGSKLIGDGHPVYFVAEVGATHTGFASAVNLVDIAIEAGFDAVKFQIVESAKCPHPDEVFNGHKCIDIWRQRELTVVEWSRLWRYCQKKITAYTTVTEIYQIDWFPNKTYKIRSRDIGNLSLIREVSKNAEIIQLDIGKATVGEINIALSVINNCKPILHHCPSGYPAKIEDEKIGFIQSLKILYPYPIAYSAHSNNPFLYAIAIAKGANMLEIPIKEDDSKSIAPEAVYALTSKIAIDRIKILREMEKAL